MIVGARNGVWSGGAKMPTARDYVQDGCINMWNILDVSGWGNFDDKANVWKDLIGGVDLLFSSRAQITRNGARIKDEETYSTIAYTDESTAPDASMIKTMEVSFVDEFTKGGNPPKAMHVLTVKGPSNTNGIAIQRGSNQYVPWYAFRHQNGSVGIRNKIVGVPITISCPNIDTLVYSPVYLNSIKKEEPGNVGNNYGYRKIQIGGEVTAYWDSRSRCDARVQCVRFYNRALTEDEIAHNYAVDQALYAQP